MPRHSLIQIVLPDEDLYGHASERMKAESATRMQNYIESVSSL